MEAKVNVKARGINSLAPNKRLAAERSKGQIRDEDKDEKPSLDIPHIPY